MYQKIISSKKNQSFIFLVVVSLFWSLSTLAQVNQLGSNKGETESLGQMREFVTSCTYGVIAGTLVGTATLAFEKNPGDSLQNVARGASLGLYAGILLGFYVVYIVPGQIEREKLQMYERQGLPPTESKKFNIYPMISSAGQWEGIFTQYQISTF